MKNLLTTLLVAVLTSISLPAIGDCGQCEYKKLASTVENGVRSFEPTGSGYQVEYEPREDILSVLTGAEGLHCQFEIGIVINAYAGDERPFLLVEGQSGSSRFVQVLNLESCLEVGESLAIEERAVFSPSEIFVSPACECLSSGKEGCDCPEPTSYRALPDCTPQGEHDS